MESSKASFLKQVQDCATRLGSLKHDMEEVVEVYNSRQYGPGVANAITDDDLITLEMVLGRKLTADDIYSFIILCDQMHAFLYNGTPAQREYSATMNKIRTDI